MNLNPYKSPGTAADKEAPIASDANQGEKPFAGCSAAFFLLGGLCGELVGTIWVYTFGFTDYRAHLATPGLLLGILTIIFSTIFLAFGFAIIRKHFGSQRNSKDHQPKCDP